jgi:hypothetical protein
MTRQFGGRTERRRCVNRFLALTLVGMVVATTLGAAVSPSQAAEGDTRPCVTRGEYRQVTKGMTKIRVHAIFDTGGKRLFLNGGEVSNEGREYPVCGHPRSGGSFVQVQYNNYATNGGPLRLSYKQLRISD